MLDIGFTQKEIVHRLELERGVERSKAELLLQVSLLQRELLLPFANRPELVSLYVNIPFCPSRCAYCSFPSHSLAQYRAPERAAYLEGLLLELESASLAMDALGLKLCTVYVGGGTPTTLTAPELHTLYTAICSLPRWDGKIELTVEAGRPETITREKLEILPRDTRISINPQTMSDATLERIGRHHSVQDVHHSFALAHELGFVNINADLIIGLPEEGAAEVSYNLGELLALNPHSITTHMFSPKRASRFTAGDGWPMMPAPEAEAASKYCAEALRRAGMRPYYLYRQRGILAGLENVGWSHPGKECLYNICVISETQAIIGIGAGASSIFPLKDSEWERQQNPKDAKMYLDRLERNIIYKRTLMEGWRSKA